MSATIPDIPNAAASAAPIRRCLPVIHIGYHKTGTTWLQRHVFSNRQFGFVSPWSIQGGEAIEAFVLPSPFRFEAASARRMFESALSAAGSENLLPVISHEDLCGYPVYGRYYGKEVCERLYETFPEAGVVVGIREQKSAILSHYRQYIRQGGAGTIGDFICTRQEKGGFSPICRMDHFEYHLLIGHYQRLFGQDRVLVLPIELLKTASQQYMNRLTNFAGVPEQPVPSQAAANIGWGGVTLALRRTMNRMNFGIPDWRRSRQSPAYRVAVGLCKLAEAGVPHAFQERADGGLRQFIRQQVGSRFVESNAALGEMTGLNFTALGYDTAKPGELHAASTF